MLCGCTAALTPVPLRTTTAPTVRVDDRSCRQSRPPGWLPSRPDGSKQFGTYVTLGSTPIDTEGDQEPVCTRSLHIEVDRLGSFTPTARTEVDGHHRRYREYRITVTNLMPHTVWLVDESQIGALDGTRPADRAVDLQRRIGVPPSDDLRVGHHVHWLEAFSDDHDDPTVIVTPFLGGPTGGPTATAIFAQH
jgi:hypothetical protein